jgi:hypothetical protein
MQGFIPWRAARLTPRRPPVCFGYLRATPGAIVMAGLVLIAGCFGDRMPESDRLTAAELAEFTAPTDSSLTGPQIDQYLRTALEQVGRLKVEAPRMRERLRTPETDSTGRPRNPVARWREFTDGSFVRSARQLGYRPAEMVYVRGRMAALSGQILAARMDSTRGQAAALFRAQADQMRGSPGVSQAQIDAMLQAAEQAERDSSPTVPPRLEQNLQALRAAHPRVPSETWAQVTAFSAGGGTVELRTATDRALAETLDRWQALFAGLLRE